MTFLRTLVRRFPFRGAVLVALLGAVAWLWREKTGLEAQLAALRAAGVTERVAARASGAGAARELPPVAAPGRPTEGKAQPEGIADAAVLAALEGEVVVSFGPVEQLGAQASGFFAAHEAARLRRRAQALGLPVPPQTPEEVLAEQRQAVVFLGALPEIAGFQNEPGEYGRFFRGLFETGAGLSAAEAEGVQRLMTARAEELIRLGLNEGNKPADGALAWEFKRDGFNEETAAQLNALLPEAARERFPLTPSLMEFLEMDFDKSDIPAVPAE